MQNTLDKIQELAIATELSITQSFPSIYSKENVLVIINQLVAEIQEIVAAQEKSIEYTLPKELQLKLIETVCKDIAEDFDNADADELVDFDSAEFSIEYNNQVQLDRIDLNTGRFMPIIESTINGSINQFFEQPQILAVDQK